MVNPTCEVKGCCCCLRIQRIAGESFFVKKISCMIPRHNYHTPAPQQADGFNTFGGWLKRLHVWLFDG